MANYLFFTGKGKNGVEGLAVAVNYTHDEFMLLCNGKGFKMWVSCPFTDSFIDGKFEFEHSGHYCELGENLDEAISNYRKETCDDRILLNYNTAKLFDNPNFIVVSWTQDIYHEAIAKDKAAIAAQQ